MSFFDFPKPPPPPRAGQPDPYIGERVPLIHDPYFVAQQVGFEQERRERERRNDIIPANIKTTRAIFVLIILFAASLIWGDHNYSKPHNNAIVSIQISDKENHIFKITIWRSFFAGEIVDKLKKFFTSYPLRKININGLLECGEQALKLNTGHAYSKSRYSSPVDSKMQFFLRGIEKGKLKGYAAGEIDLREKKIISFDAAIFNVCAVKNGEITNYTFFE